MLDPSKILAGIPEQLRIPLLESFQSIRRNFIERRWEPSELNGGKFCEVAYTIIRGRADSAYPDGPQKPRNMRQACDRLEDETSLPRSLRILVPRMIPVVYEIRNNRGVGHVGGDVDPNQMDAIAVVEMTSWILAEFVRVFHDVATSVAQRAVDELVERQSPLVWEVGGLKRVLNPSMSAKDQSLVLLYSCSGSVTASDLSKWVEYSSVAMYRRRVLVPAHKSRIIEFETKSDSVTISPLGVRYVEADLLPDM